VPLWVGNSHTFDGFNWVYAWGWQLVLVGVALLLGGACLLLMAALRAQRMSSRRASPMVPGMEAR
jgi:predicted membrane protein